MGDWIKRLKKYPSKLGMMQQIMLHLFLCLFFVVYTFYLGDGYYMIGDYKYGLYKKIVIPFLVVECLIFATNLIFQKDKKMTEDFFRIEDVFLLGYSTVIFLSLLGACDMKTAMYGYQDWFLGAFMMESFLILYLIYAKSFRFRQGSIYLYLGTGFLVSFFGYLQRCGVNLLPSQGYVQEGFSLSTLGNINWICGYLAIFYPVFMGILIEHLKKRRFRDQKLLTGLLVFGYMLSTGFVVLQGSESGWLILGISWLAYLWYACTSKKRITMDAYLITLFCSMLGIALTSKLYWYRITHGVESYYGLNRIMYSNLWFVGTLLIGAWLVIRYCVKRSIGIFAHPVCDRLRQDERKICVILRNVVFIGAAVVVLMILRFMVGYQRNPSAYAWIGSYHKLMFDLEWGHGRGAIWRTAWMTFQNGGLWRRLFGYGPDCYYHATMMNGNDLYMGAFRDMVTTDVVANAHNELLNLLVNFGLFGLVTYLGFLGSLGYRFYRMAFHTNEKKENGIAFMGLVVIVVMTIHNLVSFEQIEATPYFFLMLGMISAYCSKREMQKRNQNQEGTDKKQNHQLHLVKNDSGTRNGDHGRKRKI